jgi:adenosylcobinamide-GDP ribazoletransferase
MRDSAIGTYGALALGLTLALRVAALAAMPAALAAATLVAAHGAGRASAVLVIATGRYARDGGGAGSFTGGGLAPARLALALAAGALCLALVALAAGWRPALGALLGLAAGHLATRALTRRLGGYTGDTLGATEQLGETALALGMLACL